MLSPTKTHTRPLTENFQQDVIAGLQQSQKQIPCKYLYDGRGSALFDQICRLEEYYVTRTETEIMRCHVDEMTEVLGDRVRLIEFGSGSSVKTRLLLDHLPDGAVYIPVDISEKHLLTTAARLQSQYTQLEVCPVVADFTQPFAVPPLAISPTDRPPNSQTRRQSDPPPIRTTVYFPGSTIGNYSREQSAKLLSRIASICHTGDGLLIGVDLQKDADVLERAYNDAAGITAAFNCNLLRRMQLELNADLDLDGFEHYAFYNDKEGRIESYLRSRRTQYIGIDTWRFKLHEGELIHTEYSYKYTIAGFRQLAERAGLSFSKAWTDSRDYFAVLHFTRAAN